MIWYVKLLEQNEDFVTIGYSFEQNDTCDGIIKYEKKDDRFLIEFLSEGCNEFNTKRLFPHLYRLMDNGSLTFRPYMVAIG
ncbi:MAG: hypothetical protein ACOX3J_12310 [Clostridia bacterium]|jgi:hypothetical protein